jgi:hypothetical protein
VRAIAAALGDNALGASCAGLRRRKLVHRLPNAARTRRAARRLTAEPQTTGPYDPRAGSSGDRSRRGAEVIACTARSEPTQITGRAHVIDADSIEVDSARVRLFASTPPRCASHAGPAPARPTDAGRKPASRSSSSPRGARVSCLVKRRDQYRRASRCAALRAGAMTSGGTWCARERPAPIARRESL